MRKWKSLSCVRLCNPMNCSLAGSSVHGIFQARMLEWVVISFCRESSQPRDWTWVSCIAGRILSGWATRNLTVWITTNCRKFWKRWEYQTTWPASWEICVQIKKQELEPDMEQQTGSKSGKEYIKAVYCHPAYLTSMQSISWDMLDWEKHKLESRFAGRNINNLRYADDTTLTEKGKN